MNRNYKTLRNLEITRDQLATWANARETHHAVALAIHAISDDKRSPDAIWENPTPAEWDHVICAVEEYVSKGDFPATDNGRYPWGLECIVLSPTT